MLVERHEVPFLLLCSGAKPHMGALEGKAQEKALESGDTGGRHIGLPLEKAVLRSASDRSGC